MQIQFAQNTDEAKAQVDALATGAKDAVTKAGQGVEAKSPLGGEHEVTNPIGHAGQTIFAATLVCFAILLIILKKFAWGPILAGLDAREEKIRKSLDDAEAAAKALEDAAAKAQATIAEAVTKAREIEAAARSAAQRDGDAILARSKAEAAQQLAAAESAIANARAEAVRSLRAESAELAIQLAGKIIRIDESKARAFTSEQLQKV
ncbi:MAG: synthase subunit [Verrucomicrobiota bacterium]|jgi:F-type H+-transporting ATPase subunit b